MENNNNNNNKDGGRGLIDVETAFKTATIGLDHYLKHKEGQYPKQVLEHERSKAKNSISTNATKFKKEATMPEIDNREDKSASENAKALKHVPTLFLALYYIYY